MWPSVPNPIGARVGVYDVLSLLGTGGMGEVYLGRDTRLDRRVALKFLPEIFARDPERLLRFEREARVLASLTSGNIRRIPVWNSSGSSSLIRKWLNCRSKSLTYTEMR